MCALPKGFRNNIKLINPKVGYERREELVDFLSDKNTFLPQGVHYKDMDTTFIDFVKEDIKIVIDGEEVPVIFLTIQRYAEFTKTWQFTDEYKNIKLPFITIVRKPDVQVGTNYAGKYNIPGKPLYTYYKVPTNDGARTGVDIYKVPQPTSVDITYEVRLFTNKMSDLNLYNEKIQRAFNARQYYIWPKGHPMPLTLESIGDESNINDFENRRFYVQPFEMKLAGYILDENDFEVIPTINRAMVMSEISADPAKARPIEKNVNTRGPIVAVQGNVRVVNTLGNFISTVPCNEQYVVLNSIVSNSGSTYSVSLPATTNLSLPNVINYDSDGSAVITPAMVGFTATTCADALWSLVDEVNNELNSGSIESGGSANIVAPNGNVSALNSNLDQIGATVGVNSGGVNNILLPDVTHTDSNGLPVIRPDGVPMICTPQIRYEVLSDWVTGATGTSISYMAYATEGTPTNADWVITRITIAIDGTQVSAEATGPWDDRYILIYT